MAYAGQQFKLSARQGDGSTLREQLASVARQTGETPQELIELTSAKLPEPLAHVWQMFIELHGARTSNGFGPNAITYSEIAAHAAMTGEQATPYEISALRALDNAWMAQQAKEAERRRSKEK